MVLQSRNGCPQGLQQWLQDVGQVKEDQRVDQDMTDTRYNLALISISQKRTFSLSRHIITKP